MAVEDGSRGVSRRQLAAGDVVVWSALETHYAVVVSDGGRRLEVPDLDMRVRTLSGQLQRTLEAHEFLGLDSEGFTHLYDARSRCVRIRRFTQNELVVDDADGQHVGRDDLARWMRYVADQRGWRATATRFFDLLRGESA